MDAPFRKVFSVAEKLGPISILSRRPDISDFDAQSLEETVMVYRCSYDDDMQRLLFFALVAFIEPLRYYKEWMSEDLYTF